MSSNGYRIIQYEPEHAFAIFDRNIKEYDFQLSDYPDWEKWARGWRTEGPAFTLTRNGEIVGSAGVVLHDWRRGEAWLIFTSLFYKSVRPAIREIRKHLEEIVSLHNLKRVQALVKPDRKVDQRFIEYLGFQREGLLKAYGPHNEDYLMYGRIF